MKTYIRSMSGLNENTKELRTVQVHAILNSIELFVCVFISFFVAINIKDMNNICSFNSTCYL
jgi:hypothetical protein